MKTLVLGLGNSIMGDDGVGLRIVQEVRRRLRDCTTVDVEECYAAGPTLLDFIVGYDALVFVDSLVCDAPRGTVLQPKREQLPDQPATIDAHGMGLLGVLNLGESMGLHVPRKLSIVAVAVEPNMEASEELSAEVEAAIPEAVERVLEEVRLFASPQAAPE
ncbi:MAG: hydrogenase maturation protease [Chloroflexi bacterium]|nr:hydrogenase maturation protease [Chloroflexota bacterium]